MAVVLGPGQKRVLGALQALRASAGQPASIRQVAAMTGRTGRATTIALSNAWCARRVRRLADASRPGRPRLLYWPAPG